MIKIHFRKHGRICIMYCWLLWASKSYWTKENLMKTTFKSIQHLCCALYLNQLSMLLLLLLYLQWIDRTSSFWNGNASFVDHHVHQELCKYFHDSVINALQKIQHHCSPYIRFEFAYHENNRFVHSNIESVILLCLRIYIWLLQTMMLGNLFSFGKCWIASRMFEESRFELLVFDNEAD